MSNQQISHTDNNKVEKTNVSLNHSLFNNIYQLKFNTVFYHLIIEQNLNFDTVKN